MFARHRAAIAGDAIDKFRNVTIEYPRVRFNVEDIPPGRFDLPAGLSAPASR